jgi:hypothetical protein
MEFFTSTTNTRELKQQYKNLCMKLHPDKGGDAATFQRMHNEYIKLLSEATAERAAQVKRIVVVVKKKVVIKKAVQPPTVREVLQDVQKTVKQFNRVINEITKTLR